MQIMSKFRHSSRRRRSYVAVLASLLLVVAQFSLILHNYGGHAHPLGEVCQICVQLHGSSHALPPTIPSLPVITTVFLLLVFSAGSVSLERRFEAAQPRGPPAPLTV
jgi:hypothetical protein